MSCSKEVKKSESNAKFIGQFSFYILRHYTYLVVDYSVNPHIDRIIDTNVYYNTIGNILSTEHTDSLIIMWGNREVGYSDFDLSINSYRFFDNTKAFVSNTGEKFLYKYYIPNSNSYITKDSLEFAFNKDGYWYIKGKRIK
jgi:hypothetical protein